MRRAQRDTVFHGDFQRIEHGDTGWAGGIGHVGVPDASSVGMANVAASLDPNLPFPFPTLQAELADGSWKSVPVAVGVPVIWPLTGSIVRPLGRPVADHV